MRKRTVAFSKHAVNLFFHLLTRCNLSCAHCYINPAQHGRETLPMDIIRQWLSLFAPRAGVTNLILLGGEPTLHPDLARTVITAREMGFASVTIDTNGYLFHRILDRLTPDVVDYFSFSLDGATAATNDAIRGPGSFDAVMTGIRQARSRGFSCSMIYTVSEKNVQELCLMPDLLTRLDLERFFIQVIGLRGKSASDTGPRQVTQTLWRNTIPKVAETIARQGIIVSYPKVFLDPNDPFECAGRVADNFFVFPNGRVYRCPLCEDFPLHALEISGGCLVPTPAINETDLFSLTIPEGCVMNKMIQPGNLAYDDEGRPTHRVACCMLKEEVRA